jgi:SHS2 domain-containing protein
MSSKGDADVEVRAAATPAAGGRWEADGRAARYADHTGEIEIELRGPTMKALFLQAGESLAELILGEEREVGPGGGAAVTVTLEAVDAPSLLVAWLEELIYRADVDHAVFTRFSIDDLDDQHLTATLRDRAPLDRDNPIKAATYHGLRVDRDTDGSFTATVVLDI